MSIIAVQDSDGLAGKITYWSIEGETNYQKLKDAWLAAGLDPANLPEYPSTAEALRRAMMKQRESRRLIRPLKDDRGWAVVREKLADVRELEHQQEFCVYLTAWGTLEFEGITDPAIENEILQDYDRFCANLIAQDISGWLVHLTRVIGAIPLRPTGGFYFVPQPKLADWDKITDVINNNSAHYIHEIPAMDSAGAVRAVLDALTRDVQTFNTDLEKDIAAGAGKRALQTKQSEIDAMNNKLASYAGLLGDKLTSITDSMTAMRRRVQVCELQAAAKPSKKQLVTDPA